jgi:hypothetical protein
MTTWNPADKSALITLSNGNLSVGVSSVLDSGVRSTIALTAGAKVYFETTWLTSSFGSDTSCGIATSSAVLTSMGNSTVGGFFAYPGTGSSVWFNGASQGIAPGTPAAVGGIYCFAFDLVNSRAWVRLNNGNWNGSGTADPATNVGGVNISALFPTNAAFACVTTGQSLDPLTTTNFGATAFSFAIPSGFVRQDPPTAGNTTWNNADKSGNVTLSGTNNLTATTGINNSGIRTAGRQVSGKYYFEYVCTIWNTTVGVGVANAAAALGTVDATSTNACFVLASTGNITINNANSGSTLGARANGDIIGVALDQDNKRIWFRVAPAGNWNGSGTANPATGVGGISIASISFDAVLAPLYGLFASNGSGNVVTANFGDTAFSGTVPVGFTSGFPDTTPTLIAANTQMLVEEWGASNPAAQATQLLLEEWAVVPPYGDMRATQVGAEQWASMISPQMQATQAAIEQWTSTANVTTRMLATQAAIEQWSPVTSAVTAATRQAALTVVT